MPKHLPTICFVTPALLLTIGCEAPTTAVSPTATPAPAETASAKQTVVQEPTSPSAEQLVGTWVEPPPMFGGASGLKTKCIFEASGRIKRVTVIKSKYFRIDWLKEGAWTLKGKKLVLTFEEQTYEVTPVPDPNSDASTYEDWEENTEDIRQEPAFNKGETERFIVEKLTSTDIMMRQLDEDGDLGRPYMLNRSPYRSPAAP